MTLAIRQQRQLADRHIRIGRDPSSSLSSDPQAARSSTIEQIARIFEEAAQATALSNRCSDRSNFDVVPAPPIRLSCSPEAAASPSALLQRKAAWNTAGGSYRAPAAVLPPASRRQVLVRIGPSAVSFTRPQAPEARVSAQLRPQRQRVDEDPISPRARYASDPQSANRPQCPADAQRDSTH